MKINSNEEEEDVRKFPVVEENGWALVKDGTKTLQSTLLLQRQQELVLVDQELESKRRDFAIRMERCMLKQNELRAEQKKVSCYHGQCSDHISSDNGSGQCSDTAQIKERVEKFDRFVRENEVKRQRALAKFQNERKQQKIREDELLGLKDKYRELENRQKNLIRRIERNKKFEKYIQQVVDILPEGINLESLLYNFPHYSSMLTLLVRLSREEVLDHVFLLRIDKAQQTLAELTKTKTDEVLGYNSTIASLHSHLEKWVEELYCTFIDVQECYQKTVKNEEAAHRMKVHFRDQCQLYGELELAIKNIVEMRCRTGRIKNDSLLHRLSMIQVRPSRD
eukprot:sb/3466503/